MRLMKIQLPILLLAVIAVSGCNKNPTHQSVTPNQSASVPFDPNAYPDKLQPFLTQLVKLIGQYNSEAHGIELSEHGVKGQLDEDDAKRMAGFANSLLERINEDFDKPVSRTIGESWYQVPSRFKIAETDPHDGTTLTFTVSHHNCGLHEFDFVITNGKGRVIADRYDSLGIDW